MDGSDAASPAKLSGKAPNAKFQLCPPLLVFKIRATTIRVIRVSKVAEVEVQEEVDKEEIEEEEDGLASPISGRVLQPTA
jgi:hypothetical protein